MIHLRIIAPTEQADAAIALLTRCGSVTNLIVHRGVAIQPVGDMLSCDVAEEEASVIIHDLRELGIAESGSIDVERVDASVSTRAEEAERRSAGSPGDAVIWEHVARAMADQGSLSWGLILLFSLSGVIASVAILIDSAPIVVGAMALSPDFAPIAVFAIGAVRRRPDIAARGLVALAAGFTAGIIAGFIAVQVLIDTGVAPEQFDRSGNTLASAIAAPDWYSVVVAVCAGAAGMLSVTLSRSAALVGVAVSITTIPAAADIGLSLAYQDWASFWGSGFQLFVNIVSLLVAATLTLALQRAVYRRRMNRHRAELGLPPLPRQTQFVDGGRAFAARREKDAAPAIAGAVAGDPAAAVAGEAPLTPSSPETTRPPASS